MAFFNYRKFDDSMAEGESPPVYVVDTHHTGPPLPPRPNRKPKRASGGAQTLLFVLVGLAFLGLFIEGCLIYYLHQSNAAASPASSKQTGGEVPAPTGTQRLRPSKPVAHMKGGEAHNPYIMTWSTEEIPILHRIDYRNGSLIIQKEGYYYVYSKVFFSDSNTFYHCVKTRSKRYRSDITLLVSRKYSDPSDTAKSNSFLGGVFYFDKDDAVFVSVNETKKIRRHAAEENVFGAYMI